MIPGLYSLRFMRKSHTISAKWEINCFCSLYYFVGYTKRKIKSRVKILKRQNQRKKVQRTLLVVMSNIIGIPNKMKVGYNKLLKSRDKKIGSLGLTYTHYYI